MRSMTVRGQITKRVFNLMLALGTAVYLYYAYTTGFFYSVF